MFKGAVVTHRYHFEDMTLPDERYRSMMWADQLLKDLCDPSKTPRVPREIRQRASSVLRHWPGGYYIDRLADRSPDIIDSRKPPMDSLYTMVREYQPNPECTNPLPGEDN